MTTTGLSMGSRSRAGQPQRGQRGFVGALWLCTGVDDFRNVHGINLEHWDPRERNGGADPCTGLLV